MLYALLLLALTVNQWIVIASLAAGQRLERGRGAFACYLSTRDVRGRFTFI